MARNWAYFDHAAVSPLPRAAVAAVEDWARDTAENGDVNWSTWAARLEDVRRLFAEMLSADGEEIALVRNTTEGVTLVAEGFPWQQGDNVVLASCEFPSNRFPWLNLAGRGVEARVVDCPGGRYHLDALAAACDRRTRIVAVSWVDYAAGWRNDAAELAALAHDRGALLFLDAIQGLGVFPLDAHAAGVDFLAADGHKWLLGPEGAGVLYVRRPLLERLRPLGLGWNSAARSGDFSSQQMELKPNAARYEGGTYPMAGFLGLAASLELLARYGSAALGARLLEVTDLLCERLTGAGATIVSNRQGDRRSGIVAFDFPGKRPNELRQTCRSRGVVINCRGGHVRVSPHAYTNEEDIDRLLEALSAAT